MEPVEEWFQTAKWWVYEADKSLDQPVNIAGKLTEDIDLLFNTDDIITTFDFKQTKWKEICDLTQKTFNIVDTKILIDYESQITSLPMYNYLSEED